MFPSYDIQINNSKYRFQIENSICIPYTRCSTRHEKAIEDTTVITFHSRVSVRNILLKLKCDIICYSIYAVIYTRCYFVSILAGIPPRVASSLCIPPRAVG